MRKRERPVELCALCLTKQRLCESHIIPRFIVRKLCDEKGRFYSLAGPQNARVRWRQDDLKEYLLCQPCEHLIKPWEDYAADLLSADGNLPRPKPFKASVGRAGYAPFKLFQLSILWRAHCACGDTFRHVNLGPDHAEREIAAFNDRYNREWLVERHDHCTPREVRAKMQAAA